MFKSHLCFKAQGPVCKGFPERPSTYGMKKAQGAATNMALKGPIHQTHVKEQRTGKILKTMLLKKNRAQESLKKAVPKV